MENSLRPLAVVTGASHGIGLELARQCALHGYDLALAADTPLDEAIEELESLGVNVRALQADLSTTGGVDALCGLLEDRPVDLLLANAGHGLGRGFLDQEFDEIRHVIDTNITGTVYLIHRVARGMRARRSGRILITGSIAGFMPGTFQAVYNSTKAFIDSFSWALREELRNSGISVTCLMPGVTDTGFFARADMLDTKVGMQENKMDPAEVARIGFQALLDGEGDVVAGIRNKLEVAMANVTPSSQLAKQHRRMAEPGSGIGK